MSGRGEIHSKPSSSYLTLHLVNGRGIDSFKCLTLYNDDGKVSLNSFGTITFFTKKLNKKNLIRCYIRKCKSKIKSEMK